MRSLARAQDFNKVKINVEPDNNAAGMREICIVGLQEQIDKAMGAINGLIDGKDIHGEFLPASERQQASKYLESNVITGQGGPPNMHSMPRDDQNGAVLMSIPRNRVGAVIGKGGSEINRMQSQHVCDIQVDQKDSQVAVLALRGNKWDQNLNPLTPGVQE